MRLECYPTKGGVAATWETVWQDGLFIFKIMALVLAPPRVVYWRRLPLSVTITSLDGRAEPRQSAGSFFASGIVAIQSQRVNLFRWQVCASVAVARDV